MHNDRNNFNTFKNFKIKKNHQLFQNFLPETHIKEETVYDCMCG